MPLPDPRNEADLQPFLANAERLASENWELQLAIANYPATPRHLLEVLTRSADPQVAQTARLHVNWAGELTEGWQEALDAELQNVQLGQNDRLAVELLKIAPVPDCFFSEWVPAERFIEGLHNPYLPLRYRLKLLERLAKEPTLEPRLQVAESPETPLAVLEQLAGDLEIPIRLAVKYNSNCPLGLIELVEGQHTVATDWNTDAEQLAMLGQSRWQWIRLAVAQNPSTPPETLMQLARDAVFKIQLAVAKNPQTPANVLAVLAEHPEKTIQEAVAEHPNATEEILHQLFPTHQRSLRNRKNLPTSILERFFREAATDEPLWKQYELRHLLLREPNTATSILAELANVDLEEVRAEKLANRQYSPEPEILEGWIRDDIRFLVDIAKHPQVTLEILERLSQYPSPDVQLAVAQNSLTPESLKIQLLEELSVNPDERVQVKVAEDPNTPVAILEEIARNEFYHTKILGEIRRILASEYAANANSFKSVSDKMMSDLKHEILYPANIRVDVDRWMEKIQNSGILELLSQSSGYQRFLWTEEIERSLPIWVELLPELSPLRIKEIVNRLFNVLEMINDSVKNNDFYRSVALALVGNASTPLPLRDRLKTQLTRPPQPFSSTNENRDLLLALAYNLAIPEAERLQYLRQLISISGGVQKTIARNPNTPTEILSQLMANPGVGRQAISRNPNAPANMLAELAQDSNSTTRSWVAENPGTPAEILLQLARQPVEKTINNVSTVREIALKNPKFPPLERYRLVLLREEEQENAKAHELMARRPNSPYGLMEVVKSGDRNALYNAARNSLTPVHILEQLAKHPDEVVRRIVAENRNIPANLCLELARDSDASVRSKLAEKKLPQQVAAEILKQLANDSSEFVRRNVAANQDSPVEVLIELVNDPSLVVRANVLNNAKTPSHILTEAISKIHDTNELERTFPVKNPQMSTELLDRLTDHPSDFIRFVVAVHPNTARNTLERLAFDNYGLVRQTVAENPNTPDEVLVEMARLDNPTEIGCFHTVSTKISMRKNAPPDALEFIARKPVVPIRLDVARNSNTPSSALEWLAENEADEGVLCTVVQHPNVTPKIWMHLAGNKAIAVREAVAAQVRCPSDILEMLANDVTQEVRMRVAANPNTPVRVIERLSEDENSAVRAAAASNPNLSSTQLEQFAQDEKVEVRRAVAKNSHTPATIRESLRDLVIEPFTRQSSPTLRGLSRIYNPNTDDLPTLLSEYVQSPNAFVRFVALLHPLTPVDAIGQGSQSVFWCDRYAVADNPSTPVEMRQQLAQDCNRIIRATAKSYL